MKLSVSILVAAMTALVGFSASAQSKHEGDIIVRYNPATGVAEKLVTKTRIKSKAEAERLARTGKFQPMTEARIASNELDREAGSSSWYWNCPYCYSGSSWAMGSTSFFYYGSTYQPYWNYNYNNCNYFYYGSSSFYYNRSWAGGYY